MTHDTPAGSAALKSVVFLLPAASGYGIKASTTTLAEELRRRGVLCEFVLLGTGGMASDLRGRDFRVIELPRAEPLARTSTLRLLAGAFLEFFAFARQILAVGKTLGRRDLIVIRLHWLLPLATVFKWSLRAQAAWLMANPFNGRRYLGASTLLGQGFVWLGRWRVIGNSAATRRTFGPAPGGYLSCHLGLDPARFAAPGGGPRGPGHEFLVAGILARIIPEKGVLEAIQAVVALNLAANKLLCRLDIYGGTSEPAYLKACEAAAEIYPDAIRFCGQTKDPAAALSSVDLTLNTNRPFEAFGNAVIESMYMGKPVIATRAGGPAEIITPDVDGWLVEDFTAEALREALARISADRGQVQEFGRRAAETVRSRFLARHFGDRFLALFPDLTKEMSRAAH